MQDNLTATVPGFSLVIRPCRPTDLDALRAICVETAFVPTRSENERRFLTLTYCDPYVETELAHCFVAADENDDAVGYILCAADTRKFLKTFRRDYVPAIDRLGLRYALTARGAILEQWLLSFRAKAHLHIDLSDAARHRGTGTRLMNRLKAHLVSSQVQSVILTCASKNENAVRFYRRNGFQTVFHIFGGHVLCCDLFSRK